MQKEIFEFNELPLSPALLQAVEEAGYKVPSAIQVQSIPPLLEGRDILGQAQTGTGKTAAFALPLLQKLDLSRKRPQAIVLAPTRELALQVAEAMQGYARHMPGLQILPVYGGQEMGTQLRALRQGVHVIVGTPGRVLDHLRRETLQLDAVEMVVLDEADEMLRMGFLEDVETILSHTPKTKQIALFSATMPDAIKSIAQRHLNKPVEVHIQSATATVSTIRQRYLLIQGIEKDDALIRLLEVEAFEAVLIFARTKVAATDLAEKLESHGYACGLLNGDMSQAQRERAVERLKSGAWDIVVATDIAARGLDVERISHVINYDLPQDPETYVHRIGRTGRAGRHGHAILMVTPREIRVLRLIERATRQPIAAMSIPSREDIGQRRIRHLQQQIDETLAGVDMGFFAAQLAAYQSTRGVTTEEIAAALMYLAQKEKPLQPSEEDFPDIRVQSESRDRRPSVDRRPAKGMQRYRVEVGKMHGVQPRHLVGAIANEIQLESRHIGQIRLYEAYSTVDLPEDMPKNLFQHLKKIRVCGRPLQLSPAIDAPKTRALAPSKASYPAAIPVSSKPSTKRR